jgi:hypothetical protein
MLAYRLPTLAPAVARLSASGSRPRDIDVRRCGFGFCNYGGGRLDRRLRRRRLDRQQFRRQCRFCLFRVTGKPLPNSPSFRFLARVFLSAYPFAALSFRRNTRLLGFRTGLVKGLPQSLQRSSSS